MKPTKPQRERLIQLSDERNELTRSKDYRYMLHWYGRGTGGGWTYVMADRLEDAGWIEWRTHVANPRVEQRQDRAFLTQAGLDIIGGGKPAPWLEGWSLSPRTEHRFPLIHIDGQTIIINTRQGSQDVARLMWMAPQLLRALENLLHSNSDKNRSAARAAINSAKKDD